MIQRGQVRGEKGNLINGECKRVILIRTGDTEYSKFSHTALQHVCKHESTTAEKILVNVELNFGDLAEQNCPSIIWWFPTLLHSSMRLTLVLGLTFKQFLTEFVVLFTGKVGLIVFDKHNGTPWIAFWGCLIGMLPKVNQHSPVCRNSLVNTEHHAYTSAEGTVK